MWFTRVSLKNPVFATMVMLALVVLGIFSYQRLQVDQFPNIDFPVVVVITEYPGASPEIVESEVTKKVEEGVNSIAGINALTSRSYEGQSVVIIEFQLLRRRPQGGRGRAREGRRGAAAVPRRGEGAARAALRPGLARRCGRWRCCPMRAKGKQPSAVELTNWADQVLKKRLENVRGVGSVTLVGGTKREINIYLNPQAMEALRHHAPTRWWRRCATRTRTLPVGAIRSLEQERVVQIDARMERPEDFGKIIVTRKGGAPIRIDQVARVRDGAQEIDSLALYNGQRTLLLSVQKAQDENTIAVVDGLVKAIAEIRPQLPPGVQARTDRRRLAADPRRGGQRAAHADRGRAAHGADRVPVPQLLALHRDHRPDAADRADRHLPGSWHMFGFTINMMTLMALSLCVGLLIDDAIVVRENIVRHVQMGKTPYQAALDGTQEIGLAVLATTLSIVAVFLPIGFMEGIIGKFFHEFGITIVAAVLISMFVSFTLDPMLSSIWHDPAIDAHGKREAPVTLLRQDHRPRHRLVRPRDRPAGRGLPGASCAGRWCTSWPRCWRRSASSSPASSWCRCWAPSSCPRPTTPKPRSTSTRRSAPRSK